MADVESEKAKLHRRISQNASTAVVLERMKTLGFWNPQRGLPPDPPEEMAERQLINGELAQLRQKTKILHNIDLALQQERQRRIKESRDRRAAVKAKQAFEAKARRERWDQVRQSTIVHLGEAHSAGLSQTEVDEDLLKHYDLPILKRGEEIADAMGISLSRLRWLTYHRRATTVVHYRRYEIAKKTGGTRGISAPRPHLAKAQHWVLDHILRKVEPEAEAHGFVPGRSIVSNAEPHAGHPVVINLDLKDFFPTITFRRVKGMFQSLGYSEHAAVVFALLCTEPPRVAAEFDGKIHAVALGQRMLPQGACTSPAITNIICRKLDRRLAGLAKRHDFTYTRYADDLTFSGSKSQAAGRLIRSARSILEAEGLAENPRKTKIMRQGRRQEVTGLTVNHKPAVSRQAIRELRSIIHNVARHGLESQNHGRHPNFAAYLRGRVEFVRMVNPERGETMRAALERALAAGGSA